MHSLRQSFPCWTGEHYTKFRLEAGGRGKPALIVGEESEALRALARYGVCGSSSDGGLKSSGVNGRVEYVTWHSGRWWLMLQEWT